MNGEVRDREKTMRSLKKVDTPILKGIRYTTTTYEASRITREENSSGKMRDRD